MEHTIYDAKSGLTYEPNGEYYLIAGEDEPKGVPIGPWGQRHLEFLKKRQRVVYRELQMNGRLNSYLAEIDTRATEMFDRLMKQLAKAEGLTEALKEENQMLWVQMMNNLRNAATEIVLCELIYC